MKIFNEKWKLIIAKDVTLLIDSLILFNHLKTTKEKKPHLFMLNKLFVMLEKKFSGTKNLNEKKEKTHKRRDAFNFVG